MKGITLIILLLSFNLSSQESLSEAINASRSIYYGMNGSSSSLQSTCNEKIFYLDKNSMTKIKEYTDFGFNEYYFDEKSTLRFIFITNSKEEYRYYYTSVLMHEKFYPVLCRYINSTGKIFEKSYPESLRDARLIERAYQLKNVLIPYCDLFEIIDSLFSNKDRLLNLNVKSGSQYLELTINNLDITNHDTDDEFDPCWNNTKFTINRMNGDTIRIVNHSGCDGGHMVYYENYDYELNDFESEMLIIGSDNINYYLGLQTALFSDPIHLSLTETTMKFKEKEAINFRISCVSMNGLILKFNLK